jgi:hypothetical protein
MPRTNVHCLVSVALLIATPTLAGEPQAPRAARAEAIDMHPSALAQLIDQLGGRQISLPRAKIVSVISPRAFLVESAGPLAPTPGKFNRVVVLVDGGTIRVDPLSLVGSTVRVTGTARSVLGMQVSREVAWPPELTRDIVRRYEIRAAMLSPSVQTPDGVELVTALPEPEIIEPRP